MIWISKRQAVISRNFSGAVVYAKVLLSRERD